MPHDVFISHSTKDHALANQVCAKLESEGIQCWMAPRDIMPGTGWGEAIIDAIGDSRLMVLIFSSNANSSRPTIHEVERALHRDIVVIPFRVENIVPSKALELFISTSHWLDAFSPPLEPHLERLAEIVKRQLARLGQVQPPQVPGGAPQAIPGVEAALAGRYAIQRELGRGGTATVYLARDLRNRRDVALKVLNSELTHALGAARFLREIEIAANLNHPRILPLFDSGEAEGVLYYVMPYVEGESLRERLKREKPLSEKEALRITAEVASALSYAHGRGVIHRDIKPGNILLSGGEAVVADFGIARAISVAADEDLTETGLVIGTPVYMSPEQAAGDPQVDERSDVFSLGCVLYEMLVGEPPFTGPSRQAILTRRLNPAPSVLKARPEIGVALQQVVAKALALLPGDRYATAAEFYAALRRAAERTTDEVSISISPPPASLEVGDSFTLSAAVCSATGVALPEREVRWASSNPAVAMVDPSRGIVSAVAPGSAHLSASSDRARSEVALTVRAPRVAAVQVSAPSGTVRVGEQLDLTATTQDKRGAPLRRPVRWTTSNASVARVSSAGLVTAVAQGSVVIEAESEGVVGTASLAVAPAPPAAVHLSTPPRELVVGDSFTLAATPVDSEDNALHDRRVTWRSSDPAVVAVSRDGVVRAQEAGEATLTASCEGKSASVLLTVSRAPVATVRLLRAPVSVAVGRKFRLKATPYDARGKPLNRGVEWSSSDASVAAISPSGMVTAVKAGATVITATVEGVDGTTELTVYPAVPVADRLKAAVAHLAPWVGRLPKWWTVPAVATATLMLWLLPRGMHDEVETNERGTRVDTTSMAEAPAGTVRPDTLGGDAVEIPAVADVAVSRPPSIVQVGDTFALTAAISDELGGALDGQMVSWRSSDPRIAAVGESSGTVVAKAAGSAFIVAESGANRDSVPVVVRQAAVASVTITNRPPDPIAVGRSIRLEALTRDARNRPLEDRKVTWGSNDPGVATADALTGQVTAQGPGSTLIIAMSEARRDSLRITVAVAPEAPTAVDASPKPSPSRSLEAQIRSAVNVCLEALRSNNANRLAELYRAVTQEDKEREEDLLKLMRTPERRFSAVDPLHAPAQILSGAAHAEFRIKLQWRSSFGAKRERLVTFRTDFRRTGETVQPLSCGIVGPADLD